MIKMDVRQEATWHVPGGVWVRMGLEQLLIKVQTIAVLETGGISVTHTQSNIAQPSICHRSIYCENVKWRFATLEK